MRGLLIAQNTAYIVRNMIKTKTSNMNAKRAFCVDCAYHKKKVNMWGAKLKNRQRTFLFANSPNIAGGSHHFFLQIIGKSNSHVFSFYVHLLFFVLPSRKYYTCLEREKRYVK